MQISRWYIRCRHCLSVAAITEQPSADLACGLCDGPIDIMGRVQQDRLVREEYRTPCDDRCTFARGPHCDCKCGGKNHGSKRIVRVIRDCGPVPRVQMPASYRARRIAAEWIAAREYARSILDRLLDRRRADGWLPAGDFTRLRNLQRALHRAYEAKTQDSRLRALRDVLGELPAPPEPEPLASTREPEAEATRQPFDASAARQTALFA